MRYRLFILATIAIGLLACKPHDVKKDFSSKIVGRWKLVEYNGHAIETNNRTIFTFNQDLTGTQSSVEIVNRQGKLWRRQVPLTYHVDNDVLTTEWAETSTPESWITKILTIENGQMSCDASTRFVNQVPTLVGTAKYQDIKDIDYSTEIIGRWEGIEGGGQHGDSEHNWEYRADGTYTYYSWNGSGWESDPNNIYNEYAVDGDFFVTQWDSSEVVFREAHDVTIEGDMMKWHGLRANGKQDSFLLHRITPSQSKIKDVLTGKWIVFKVDGDSCLTNNKSVHTFDGAGNVYYTVANQGTLGQEWQNQTRLTYTLLGNDLTEMGYSTDGYLITYHSQFYKAKDDTIEVISSVGAREGTITLVKDHSVNYKEKIIGLWEGVEMTGKGTYGDAHGHRWRYDEDGNYHYYTRQEDGSYKEQEGFHEYMLDGSFFACRWNNDQGGIDYEWWDLTISDDGIMQWNALRQDEEGLFRNHFIIKRVTEE